MENLRYIEDIFLNNTFNLKTIAVKILFNYLGLILKVSKEQILEDFFSELLDLGQYVLSFFEDFTNTFPKA